MTELTNQQRAIELLQELGLKEYEAKCFVALSRLPSGTAKQISEISEVPRTRVYDATRMLESMGLVEVQHSSPQRFRSTGIEEAMQTLQDNYSTRMSDLRSALDGIDAVDGHDPDAVSHEVWSLSGSVTIAARTQSLVDEATREVMLIVGDESAMSEQLLDALDGAAEAGISIIVGALSPDVREEIAAGVTDAEVFVSELEWLQPPQGGDDHTAITRMLLVDRETILVSTTTTEAPTADHEEQAIFGRGFSNGLVVISRRLMTTGLIATKDPGVS